MEQGTSSRLSSIAHRNSRSDANCTLSCLVKGDSAPFMITARLDDKISKLQSLVYKQKVMGILCDINAADLVLLKVGVFQNSTQIASQTLSFL
jgi:hypothetical protein